MNCTATALNYLHIYLLNAPIAAINNTDSLLFVTQMATMVCA
jgi:hypothetical protein